MQIFKHPAVETPPAWKQSPRRGRWASSERRKRNANVNKYEHTFEIGNVCDIFCGNSCCDSGGGEESGSRDEGKRGGPRQTSRTGTRRCTRLYREANNVLYLNIYGSRWQRTVGKSTIFNDEGGCGECKWLAERVPCFGRACRTEWCSNSARSWSENDFCQWVVARAGCDWTRSVNGGGDLAWSEPPATGTVKTTNCR